MSDVENTAPVKTGEPIIETVEVSKPISNSKPYDDEFLDAYAEEASKEEGKVLTEEKKEEPKPEEKKEEVVSVKKEEPKPEIPLEDTSLKRTINGKEVEFKVKDAILAYTKQEEFNRNMDRRITHISKREKAWESSQTELKGKLGEVVDSARKGDFVNAVRGLAKIATTGTNLDAAEFERQYFEHLDSIREVYSKLTPQERDAYFAKRALADAKEEASRLKAEKAHTVQTSQLQEQVSNLQREHGIEDTEFWEHYEQMSKALVGEGKEFKHPNEITPKHVVGKVLEFRQRLKVEEAAESLGLEDSRMKDDILKLVSTSPELSTEDIVAMVKASGILTIASPDAVENLNRKAERSKTQFSRANSTKKENDNEDGYDQETLEELYRHQPKAYQRIRY